MKYEKTARTSVTAYAESPSRVLGRDTERVGWLA